MKKYQYLLLPAITLVIFIVWTILVKTVDVQYIQDVGFLGFYNFNTSLDQHIQTLDNDLFHAISNGLLVLSFLTIVPFAAMGLVQLIVKKNFKKVDVVLYLMLASYLIMVFSYFIFELVKINFSPLSVKDDLHASYPSSHVLIFVVIMGTNLYGLFYYLKMNKIAKISILCVVIALVIAMLITRLFSGHHYFTDIVGAMFLSANLLSIFDSLTRYFIKNKKEENS